MSDGVSSLAAEILGAIASFSAENVPGVLFGGFTRILVFVVLLEGFGLVQDAIMGNNEAEEDTTAHSAKKKITVFNTVYPARDDHVAIRHRNKTKLGIVDHISSDSSGSGTPKAKVTHVFSNFTEHRPVDEIAVVDRMYTQGETVSIFENEHPDSDPANAIRRISKSNMIGHVIDVRHLIDIEFLSFTDDRRYVACNIPGERVTMVKGCDNTSQHLHRSYVFYEGWLGRVRRVKLMLYLNYGGKSYWVHDHETAIKRSERSTNKHYVPGEIVQVAIYHLKQNGVNCFSSTRRRGQSQLHVNCTVEDIQTHECEVAWLNSQLPSEQAPKRVLTKEQIKNVSWIVIPNFNDFAIDSRVRVKLEREDIALTFNEYTNYIHNKYDALFSDTNNPPPPPLRLAYDSDSASQPPPQKNAKVVEDSDVTFGRSTNNPQDTQDSQADAISTSVQSQSKPEEAESTSSENVVQRNWRRSKRNWRWQKRKTNHSKSTLTAMGPLRAVDYMPEMIYGEILHTQTLVDVEWMNGNISRNVPSRLLSATDPDLDMQDHLPSEIIARKDMTFQKARDEYGVIQYTDYQERVAMVHWYKYNSLDQPPEKVGEEKCTLFDIMLHPQFLRVSVGGICLQLSQSKDMLKTLFVAHSYRKNGQVEGRTLSGETVVLWPHEFSTIFIPGEDDDNSETASDDSDSSSNSDGDDEGWVTVQEDADEEPGDSFIVNIIKGANAMTPRSDSPTNEEDSSPLNSVPPLRFSRTFLTHCIELKEKGELTEEYVIKCTVYSAFLGMLNKLFEIYVRTLEEAQRVYPSDFVAVDSFIRLIQEYQELQRQLRPATISTNLSDDFCSLILDKVRQQSGMRRVITYCSFSMLFWVDLMNLPSDASRVKAVMEMLDTAIENIADIDSQSVESAIAANALISSLAVELKTPVVSSVDEPTSKVIVVDCHTKCGEFKWYKEPTIQGKSIRRIAQELKNLANDLPNDIFIISFEDRFDALSAVIMGPEGTPFEGTPFLFEIMFPVEYPNVPPQVRYKPYSAEQLNPNLYQCGKVCISLLGTWHGEGNERWTSNSTILQLVLSIQALILVREPFFNEAGYETRRNLPGIEQHSARYNETVVFNSLDYMARLYNKPPEGLKSLIRKQIEARYPIFRNKIKSWIAGTDENVAFPLAKSTGFFTAIEKSLNRMDALIGGGADENVAPLPSTSSAV